MNRIPILFALAGVLVATACEDQPTSPPAGQRPSALISDASHDGLNKEVFFLPPMVANPSGSPFFKPGEFNPNLTSAVIRVCHMVGGDCATVVASFGAGQATGPISISLQDEHYLALWHTDESSPALVVGQAYRVEVFPDGDLNAAPVAWADVAVVNTGKELKNLNTNETIGLIDGRTLPIKVRFQHGIRCESENCASARVDNEGETLILQTGNGALVLQEGWLPAGIPEVTVTVQRHETGPDNDCVGNAAYTGPGLVAQREACLEVTTDPPLLPGAATGIQRPAFVFLCTEASETDPLRDFLQIIKADDGLPLEALKDVSDDELISLGFDPTCEGTPGEIGLGSHPVMRLAGRALHAITRPVARLLEVKPLYAIDLGQGGEIPIGGFFSHFTLGVMGTAAAFGTTPETAETGSTVTLSTQVTGLTVHPPGEIEDDGLAGIDVTFAITDGDGGLTDPADEGELDPVGSITVQTNADGVATVELTVAEGANVIEAIAKVGGSPVTLPVTFNVTGTSGEGFPITTLQTGLEYPKGMWIKDGFVYFTETAGRNTSFGGRIRLLRSPLDGDGMEVLIDNPSNSDGVVVGDDGKVYLTSYQGTSPGESGAVSVAQFVGEGWVESHLLDLEIASHDMFIDSNQDIYIIGSSDAGATAKSLYRLAAPNYATEPTVYQTGLGRAQSLTIIQSIMYYSKFAEPEVRRFNDGNELFIDNATVLSMTSDGTYLYYAEAAFGPAPTSWIRRKHLATGGVETLATLATQVNAVRYDTATGTLFFLEGGTPGNEYKDGALKSITGLGPPIIP